MRVVFRGLLCAALLATSTRARAEPTPEPKSAAKPALPVLIYMRTEGQPLSFSARAKAPGARPHWCAAPCNARFAPGEYELELNGVPANPGLELRRSGTLYGEYQSHEGARTGAWLSLNVGGIIGGVFITVAALGGPSWAYIAGGGSLAAGGLIFYLTYRPDTASVGFTPSAPRDVRGMPLPEPAASVRRSSELGSLGSPSLPGLGLRVVF